MFPAGRPGPGSDAERPTGGPPREACAGSRRWRSCAARPLVRQTTALWRRFALARASMPRCSRQHSPRTLPGPARPYRARGGPAVPSRAPRVLSLPLSPASGPGLGRTESGRRPCAMVGGIPETGPSVNLRTRTSRTDPARRTGDFLDLLTARPRRPGYSAPGPRPRRWAEFRVALRVVPSRLLSRAVLGRPSPAGGSRKSESSAPLPARSSGAGQANLTAPGRSGGTELPAAAGRRWSGRSPACETDVDTQRRLVRRRVHAVVFIASVCSLGCGGRMYSPPSS